MHSEYCRIFRNKLELLNMKNILFVLGLFPFSLTFAQLTPVPTPKQESVAKFDEVLTYISKLYVDDVNVPELTESAIIAMLEKLDPHSTYISKEDVKSANERINGSFVGIGIRYQILKDTLMVVATIPGGPSEKIGIRAGDKITKIEGKLVAGVGLKTSDVREKLMGELGTKVKIEVRRKSVRNPLDFVILRDKIPVHSVDCAYMVTPQTGYIKLTSFSRTTTEEVRASIKTLIDAGMTNLILDLQDNGGGLMYAARDVSDEFLSSDKLIVYSEGRSQPRQNLNAGLKGLWESGKLVVLTNENTASASEIVSGAIQDWDRGLIVGRRTFGKGLVQKPIDLSDGSEIRLTIARYFTPSGRFIQKPYDDIEAYKNDYKDRYLRGEFMHQDSIKKFPDSLKFTTKIKKRTVFGGGGIMPDIFVALDTADITEYFKSLAQGGHFNTFCLSYVDKNRDQIFAKYPDFETFNSEFKCDKKFMDEFFAFVKKDQPELEFNEKEYKTSEDLIKLRLKAMVAQDVWGLTEFYKVYNATNEILQEAIKVIESKKYDEAGLDN